MKLAELSTRAALTGSRTLFNSHRAVCGFLLARRSRPTRERDIVLHRKRAAAFGTLRKSSSRLSSCGFSNDACRQSFVRCRCSTGRVVIDRRANKQSPC